MSMRTLLQEKKKKRLTAAMVFLISIAAFVVNSYGGDSPTAKFTYVQGKKYIYQWRADLTARTFTKHFDTVTNSGVTEKKESSVRLNADVQIRPIGLVGTSHLMEMNVSNPIFTQTDEKGNIMEAEDIYMDKELARTVFFLQAPNGKISNLEANSAEDPGSLNIKRGILSALQTKLFYSADKAAIYPTEESDVSGAYTANYSSSNTTDTLIITKTRGEGDYKQYASGAGEGDVILKEVSTSFFNTKTNILDSVQVKSSVATVGANDQTVPMYGISSWSEAFGQYRLDLLRVETSTATILYPRTGYTAVSITATDFEPNDEPVAATSSRELIMPQRDGLVSKNTGLDYFNHLVSLLTKRPGYVSRLGQVLSGNLLSEEMVEPAVCALGVVGSSEAQDILINEVINNDGVSAKNKHQGMAMLSLVKEPTPATVSFLENLANCPSHPMHRQAAPVLGAVAEKLAKSNPERAGEIVKFLESSLSVAVDISDIDLFIGALGNAASPSSINLIGSYLDDPSVQVRYSAVDALRKYDTPEAEAYLKQVLAREPEDAIKKTAAKLLARHSALPEDVSIPMANFNWNWDRKFGGSDVYGKLSVQMASNNNSGDKNFYLFTESEAKAHAWSWDYSLMKVNACSEVVNHNGAMRRRFINKVYVKGNRVADSEHYLDCGQSKSGVLYNTYIQAFSVEKNFYPLGIKVTLKASAGGQLTVSYSYGFNACVAPVNANAFVKITPFGCVTATGEVSVSLFLVKVGATISADILKTQLEKVMNGISQPITPDLRVKVKANLETQAISGKLKIWAKRRKLFGGWSTILEIVLWSFSSAHRNETLIDYTWVVN